MMNEQLLMLSSCMTK